MDSGFTKRAESCGAAEDHQSKRSRPNADVETRMFLKMLLPEKEVGNVIGKGGAVLKRICDESGARVRISAHDELVPGTRNRVATISGTLQALLSAQHAITAALFAAREKAEVAAEGEDAPMGGVPADKPVALKLLFPHQSCGVVMGKGGAFIKELGQSTGATIKVSQPDELIVATQERVITIFGTTSAVDQAQNAICTKMASAPFAQQIKETDYSVFKFPSPANVPPGWSGFARATSQLGDGRSMAAAPHLGAAPSGAPMPFKHFMATLDDHVTPEQAQHKCAL